VLTCYSCPREIPGSCGEQVPALIELYRNMVAVFAVAPVSLRTAQGRLSAAIPALGTEPLVQNQVSPGSAILIKAMTSPPPSR
jgi:hypothetical protein